VKARKHHRAAKRALAKSATSSALCITRIAAERVGIFGKITLAARRKLLRIWRSAGGISGRRQRLGGGLAAAAGCCAAWHLCDGRSGGVKIAKWTARLWRRRRGGGRKADVQHADLRCAFYRVSGVTSSLWPLLRSYRERRALPSRHAYANCLTPRLPPALLPASRCCLRITAVFTSCAYYMRISPRCCRALRVSRRGVAGGRTFTCFATAALPRTLPRIWWVDRIGGRRAYRHRVTYFH